METTIETRLLARKDAASILGISIRTLDRLANAGEVQKVYIGGKTQIDAASIQDLIERGRAQAMPEREAVAV
ncbi:helix-turn-helix domain-containing protein [Puniceicoccales bacterium CK1056]|uniref:Helix-turn-helix domain-containing protein n=1 Tax=Oceanipulchritudo coccoides TaxID=2706888 RepID=A0A6B2LWZ2_9BACT|nr:helix-turn-helix domain-containing protein [Oceanipulchritudo coccoides]NDV60971.1 helix-turn-helix domain-containing protein [Oceanipulchritudo coccoides]